MAQRPPSKNSQTNDPKALLHNGVEEGIWLPVKQQALGDKGKNKKETHETLYQQGFVEEKRPQELPFNDWVEALSFWGRVKFRLGLMCQRPTDWLWAKMQEESEQGAGFLWAPVFFGLGCLIYFSLPREPLSFAFPFLAVLFASAVWKIPHGYRIRSFLLIGLFVAMGASLAQWRAARVNTVMLSHSVIANVSGLVVNAEYRFDGSTRYTLKLDRNKKSGNEKAQVLPQKVRLTARKGGPKVKVGEWIEGKARLGPPPGPTFPNAYDFSFQSWFSGIGASGFFLGKPVKSAQLKELQYEGSLSFWLYLARIRASITEIIHNALPNRSGALAAALIVGDRSGIDPQTAENLRRSGLAHILAISGLHMALVVMTVIVSLRAAFACFPALVLHYPVRKWASCAGLLAATVYLFLSGINVSTQRAYIMVSIMLLAVLLDRRALSMRNVAWAAFIVLAMTPETILMPGFQMSFAAVAALVGTYEVLNKWRRKKHFSVPVGGWAKFAHFVFYNVGGLALTSLIAGLATGVFAAYHFYRVAPFGLLANLLAMPFVSLAVMPLALIAVLAMPFGLEAAPLHMMAVFTEAVVAIAQWVVELGPQGNTGYLSPYVLVSAVMALLCASLMRTQLKLVSIVFVGSGVLFIGSIKTPDVLILENGKQVGVMHGQDGLSLLKPNADKFSTRMWSAAFDPSVATDKQRQKLKRGQAGKGYQCDDFGCSIKVKGQIITYVKNTARLWQDCLLADVLIVPFRLDDACADVAVSRRPLVIDGKQLNHHGAHALYLNEGENGPNITIDTAYQRPLRPWNRHRSAKSAE